MENIGFLLINGILHNSEAWSDLKLEDIKLLEDVDEYLLRSIFKAHSKTSIELLHLETGTKPIKHYQKKWKWANK